MGTLTKWLLEEVELVTKWLEFQPFTSCALNQSLDVQTRGNGDASFCAGKSFAHWFLQIILLLNAEEQGRVISPQSVGYLFTHLRTPVPQMNRRQDVAAFS